LAIGTFTKIHETLLSKFYKILKSYMQQRRLIAAYNNATSLPIQMSSAEPQGSVLGPLLYTLFTADFPQQHSTVSSTHADGTAVMSRNAIINRATTNLQTQPDSTTNWTGKWRLKLNESKSTRVTFMLLKGNIPKL
jgi:hypothetical protein